MLAFLMSLLFFSVIIFFIRLSSLLASLIVLEVISFLVLSISLIALSSFSLFFSLIIFLFCFFVIESVLGLMGLVLLISHVGQDYLTLSVMSL